MKRKRVRATITSIGFDYVNRKIEFSGVTTEGPEPMIGRGVDLTMTPETALWAGKNLIAEALTEIRHRERPFPSVHERGLYARSIVQGLANTTGDAKAYAETMTEALR